mmetsp:Transcript_2021/g.7306  ORF Transcript_2021/g.7306 Transcript_2021/m.7306 type:complete len:259 (-) Transcript_2021:53-829(-)
MAQPKLEFVKIEPCKQVVGVVVVTMCRPRVNALSSQLMREISEALKYLATVEEVKGALLVSAFPKCYCAGLDLTGMREMATMSDEEATEKLREFAFDCLEGVLRSCLSFPKPLATVVEGHALAGGFIVALTADYMALSSTSTAKIGLTELAVGVPFPWLPQAVAEQQLGRTAARRLMFDATVMGPEEAHTYGFGDCLTADPLKNALDWLDMTTTRSPTAFALTKKNYWRPVLNYKEDREVELKWSRAVLDYFRSFAKM